MTRRPRIVRPSLAASLLAFAAICGCERSPRDELGYGLTVPAGWVRWTGEAPLVPGRVLEAYSVPAAPARGSLVVFRSKFAPNTTAAQLAVERRMLLAGLPGLAPDERMRVHAADEIDAGATRAARIEATGPGTGASLAPTSLGVLPPATGDPWIPTRRVWIVIPRGTDLGTLEILLHVPDGAYAALRPEWDAVLASLEVDSAER